MFLFQENCFRQKEQWYRLPEREAVQTKADRSLIGSLWNVTRHVARVGYYFEHFDPEITKEHDAECHKIMMDLFELRARQMPEGISQQEFDKLNRYIEQSINFMAERYDYPKKIVYKARGKLVENAYRESGKEKLRALWYLDIKCPSTTSHLPIVKITGIKQCWTGKYYPVSSSYADYDPAGLENQVHHSLYRVLMSDPWYEPVEKDPDGKWLEDYGNQALIHPEDLIPLESESIKDELFVWFGDVNKTKVVYDVQKLGETTEEQGSNEYKTLTENMSSSEYRRLTINGSWENESHKR